MAWSAADIPPLDDKTAVVTGANGGLGLETARELARKGVRLVMAARNEEKTAAAESAIRAEIPNAWIEIVPLDLGSLASVREAAAQVLAGHERVDILVNNAGVMGMPEQRTEDGFEMQLGVDHLGHWAFTAKLMPAILAAPAARVVTVTSTAHHMGRAIDPDNPNLDGKYGPWKAYGQAKLANFHFGFGLQRRFEAAGVDAESLIAHPGFSNTDLQQRTARENADNFWARFFAASVRRTGMNPAEGALSQLRAATDPNARGGEFYGPLWVNSGPPVRKPIIRRLGMSGAIETLWQVSERETGERIEIANVPEAGLAS